MGKITWQLGNRVYLDTNLFIYAVEEIVPYAQQVKALFEAADRDEIALVTSLLTLAETLVMPYRQGDDMLIATYCELFMRPPPRLLVVQLDAAILVRAAKLRAAADNLRLPDALHIATAEAEGCDLFLTNDRRLKTESILPVAVLAEAG